MDDAYEIIEHGNQISQLRDRCYRLEQDMQQALSKIRQLENDLHYKADR